MSVKLKRIRNKLREVSEVVERDDEVFVYQPNSEAKHLVFTSLAAAYNFLSSLGYSCRHPTFKPSVKKNHKPYGFYCRTSPDAGNVWVVGVVRNGEVICQNTCQTKAMIGREIAKLNIQFGF